MERDRHLGEAAELYAIGSLDADERAAVERHAADCPACLRLLGEAEEAVLALERGNLPISLPYRGGLRLPLERRDISAWWLAPAVAAALVVGLLLSRLQPQSDTATLAMVTSHFAHAQFSGTGGPPAKVLYARDRSWYYIVVAGTYRYEVYGVRDGTSTHLGNIEPSGNTSRLFTRTAAPFDRLELRDGSTLVESAAIR
ncbi:MAG: zf-HC2 domain-containing protein [Candidatus Baltobacteraceae bacterium]